MPTIAEGVTPGPQPDSEPTPPQHGRTGPASWDRVSPIHIACAVVGGAIVYSAASPINDLDVYWHVALGREILSTGSLHHLGEQWLAVTPPSRWITSQWASEVGMALIADSGGWKALILMRLTLITTLMAMTAWTLLRRHPPLVAGPVLMLTWAGTVGFIQDRPQTLSFVFVALLSEALTRLRNGEPLPRWTVAIGVVIWAQFHGLWILAPAAFLLATLCLQLSVRDGARLRTSVTLTFAACAGVINPHGLESFVLPLRFADSAGLIAEWRPTTFNTLFGLALGGLLILSVSAWAAFEGRIPPGEIAWVFLWLAFSLAAFRNVLPAILMIAPVAASAADRTWGRRLARIQSSSGLERQVLRAAIASLVLAALVGTTLRVRGVEPLAKLPAPQLAAWVSDRPEPVKIFNAYNVSSSLILLGEGKARLFVDGRADMWGGEYLDRLVKTESGAPGWDSVLRRFDPDVVIVGRETPLVSLLTHGGWRVTRTDGQYALLVPSGR